MVTSVAEKRDPAATRGRILQAAARAFAQHGLDGARMDAIAAEARVNKRMLYHYFSDKQGLFAAVIDDRLGRGALGVAAPAVSALQDVNVQDLRLLVWAAASETVLPASARTRWQQLLEELAAAQRAGRLRSDVEAAVLALAILATAALPVLMPHLVGIILGLDGEMGAAERARLQARLATLWESDGGAPKHGVSAGRPRVRMLPDVRKR